MNDLRQIMHRYAHWLSPLLGIVLFGASLWAILQELHHQSLVTIFSSVRAIPIKFVGAAVFLTLLNYWALTGYDTLAAIYVHHSLPYFKTSLVSVISYAVSNSVGLALLSGSAIRYRFYSTWGVPIGKIAQMIAFCNLSFWLGLLAAGGILFLIEPIAIPQFLHLPFDSVHPIGIIFIVIIIIYLLWNALGSRSLQIASWTMPHLPTGLLIAQMTIAALDWALAAAVLYSGSLPSDVHCSLSKPR
jgi:uncharacterized membrane protein YbhN (UPF0104 family)